MFGRFFFKIHYKPNNENKHCEGIVVIEVGPRELTVGASQSMTIMNSSLSFNCERFD